MTGVGGEAASWLVAARSRFRDRLGRNEQRLLWRVLLVRWLAVVVYLAGLPINPRLAGVWPGPFLIALAGGLWMSLVWLAVGARSARATAVVWAVSDVIIINLGNLWLDNPFPVAVLFGVLPGASVALFFYARGAFVASLAYLGVYFLVVFPVVQPEGLTVVVLAVFMIVVNVSIGLGASFLAGEARAADRGRAEVQAVLDGGHDPMLLLAPSGRINAANRAAAVLFGIERGGLAGRTVESLGATADALLGAGRHWFATGRDDEFRARLRGGDGGRTIYEVSGRVIGDMAGGLNQLWTLRDVTAAEDSQRERAEFMSLATHEMRAPLTTMRAFVDLYLDGQIEALPQERRRELLLLMRNNTERWMTLIDDLLTMSRVESDVFRLAPEALVLRPALEFLVDRVRPQVLAAEQEIKLVIVPQTPDPLADPTWFSVMVGNLLSNAIKYTPAGGSITVGAYGDGERVSIWVRDNGIGMTAQQQVGLFTRFYRVRTDETRGIAGSGLGLAITRRLAEAHGGGITVTSAPLAGSTFTLRLPIAPPAGA